MSDVIKDQRNVFFDARLIRLSTWGKRLFLKKKASDFFCDGVHPSEMTYRLWAKETLVFILEETNIMFSININRHACTVRTTEG